jgi:hypothetical protein
MLTFIERHFFARRYLMVDGKQRILLVIENESEHFALPVSSHLV